MTPEQAERVAKAEELLRELIASDDAWREAMKSNIGIIEASKRCEAASDEARAFINGDQKGGA